MESKTESAGIAETEEFKIGVSKNQSENISRI